MSVNEKYIDITNLINEEFLRNIRKYGDKIKCGKGCSQCCNKIFSITLLDSFIIKKYFTTLSEEEKSFLKNKARLYKEKSKAFKAEAKKDLDFISPCPALDDEGSCMIYEARPVICRRFGTPIYDYKNPAKIYACELNFKSGEEISDNELIDRQTIIGKMWDEMKTEFNVEMKNEEKISTTIAEAIISA